MKQLHQFCEIVTFALLHDDPSQDFQLAYFGERSRLFWLMESLVLVNGVAYFGKWDRSIENYKFHHVRDRHEPRRYRHVETLIQ